MLGEGGIVRRRALSVGLALWAILSFSIGQVAECAGAVAVGAGSQGVAHAVAWQAHSESEEIGSAGHRCHHDIGHKHKGAGSTVYAAPRRVADQVAAAPVGPDATDWSAAGALVLFGVRRRGPPYSISRSSPSGRHILISLCVTRT